MNDVQAVILAGGEGKRIAPLGTFRPKSMFEIMGRPLIAYVVEALTAAGITDLVIVTGPRSEQIREYLGDGARFGVKVRYTLQAEPLGQANALQTAAGLIDRPFFVLNANDIFEHTLLERVLAKAGETRAGVVLVGRRVSEPWRFGVMRFDAEGRLAGVVEKPPAGQEPSDMAVVGLWYLSPEIFACIERTPRGESDDQFERAYQMLIDRGEGAYVPYEGPFESYKFPWNLLRLSDLLLSRIEASAISPTARIAANAAIEGEAIIEDGVRVFEYATIRGPAYIGAGSVVGNNALIWGGCSIGRRSVIGYGSEIKHSIMGNNCWTHRNYVGDSIVADNCSFGAGTITANFRFDEEEVQVAVDGRRIGTGTDKLGVIMAEGCRTGCNAVILPGLKIGPNSIVGPGVTLMDDLGPNKIALLDRASYTVRDNRLDLTGHDRAGQLGKITSGGG